MIGALLSIVPNIVGAISDNFKQKRELKAAIKQQQIEAVREGKQFDASWEEIQAKNSASSWKDEFALVVIMAPIILAAVGYPEVAQRAFEAFQAAPDWYQTCLLVAIGASFGVKLWTTRK